MHANNRDTASMSNVVYAAVVGTRALSANKKKICRVNAPANGSYNRKIQWPAPPEERTYTESAFHGALCAISLHVRHRQ